MTLAINIIKMEKLSKATELIEHKESGWFNGKRYNVGHLYVWASEKFPVEDVCVSDLQNQLEDQKFDSIPFNKIDMNKPILLSHTNHIIDGKHRLYKAVTENHRTIKAIRLPEELPIDTEL